MSDLPSVLILLLPAGVLVTLAALLLLVSRRTLHNTPAAQVDATAVPTVPARQSEAAVTDSVTVPSTQTQVVSPDPPAPGPEAVGADGIAHLLVGATAERSQGRPDAAAALLRTAIRSATAIRRKDLHAAARLALGDLDRESGDLTSACEQWQLARALYHDASHAAGVAEADARMRENGCPTDWVLNDF